MGEHRDDYVDGPPSTSGAARMPSDIEPIRPIKHVGTSPQSHFRTPEPRPGAEDGAPEVPTPDIQEALYQSVRSQPIFPRKESLGSDGVDPAAAGADCPTNIYFIAQYQYQISLSAVPMADHELGMLLPRSGRIWFNARLFSDVPRGRELATRDVWWRVIDASQAIRFLLGWSISLYRTARFQGVVHRRLPDWTHLLYFSPTMPDYAKRSVRLWSDVICDVTNLFAPRARVRRQLQAAVPISASDLRVGSRRVGSDQNVDLVLRFLADQNNCPAALIQRSLDGNPPIDSLEEYLEFTEAVMRDIPRLQMQRTIAMRNSRQIDQRVDSGPLEPALAQAGFGSRLSGIPDPRWNAAFWKLHL
ncbi:MAG: hypothetical protein ACLQUY_13010 [Ktedonobacterales bacterium]